MEDHERNALLKVSGDVSRYENICRGCKYFRTAECCNCPAVKEEPYLQLEACKRGYWDKKLKTDRHTLTVGMAVYDDLNGVEFTIQNLRMGPFKHLINEILVIDNNPTSKQGKMTEDFIKRLGCNARYIPYTEKQSTSVRTLLFEYATSDYVMVLDCHVLLDHQGAPYLSKFLKDPISDDLFHGVILKDDMTNMGTEMREEWHANFFGSWFNRPGTIVSSVPFEIRMQGLGLFMARRQTWLGFPKSFKGWGGEEGYIQAKYRKEGRKAMCLPFLRWWHRFDNPHGTIHHDPRDKIHNYTVGWMEIGYDIEAMRTHLEKTFHPKLVHDAINDGLATLGLEQIPYTR